jgi:inosose dehydratase
VSVGYAINQWKPGMAQFVRTEEHERAFKTIAACGFDEVELRAGSFRWEPLGRPERIVQYYGSIDAFVDVLHACGIQRVASFFFDPGDLILEEPSFGRDPLDPADRDGIVAAVRPFAEFLQEVGGSTLVVRPVGSFWRTGALAEPQLDELAATWNAVGELGVRVALHVDALSALQTPDAIAAVLERANDTVGLAIDTAELTIAGIDPVQLYERHADRVAHLHLKDVRATDTLGERTKPNAELEFLSAGGERGVERWFWELGTDGGLVDFPALFAALAQRGYDGTIVVESDHSPDPAGSVMLNGWYLSRHMEHRRAAPWPGGASARSSS